MGVDENERPACDWKGKTMEGVPVLLSSIDRRRAAWARYMENYERIAEQDIASRAAGTRGVLPGGPGRTGSRDTIGPACLHMPPCGSGKGRMIYAFEDFELDTDLHELRRGGERVELQPRVLRLLLHLLRQRQRVVPRDELFEEVWEGVAVSDHALFHALQKLRSALGESGERQRIIRTVPRVGYRFAVAVDERAGSSAALEPSGTPPARGDAPHPGPVLIGREPELAALRSALTEALAGSGRVVLIEGPAGIGKSRLAEEAAAFSAGRGAEVHRASAYQGTGAPPFWLWAQVLRTVADTWSEDVLRRTMGEGASAIARLAPALEAKLGVTPPAVTDSDEARFHLLDAVVRMLARAARERPQVLVLEDLHWAGPASLFLLGFLAASLARERIGVVATCRVEEVHREHPIEAALAECERHDVLVRLPLGGLSAAEVGGLIEQVAGLAPSAEIAGSLADLTGGNPFFVKQIVRLAAEEEARDGTGFAEQLASSVHRIPPSVRRVVDRRLATLSDACRGVIETAAVAGPAVAAPVLVRACELSGDALLAVLEEAMEARLVEPVSGPEPGYRFVHALVREGAYAGLPESRRVQLHLRVAEALESAHAGDLDPVVPALAHHYGEAALLLEDDRAVDHAQRAGEQARAALSYEEAADHSERALRALELRPEPEPRRRAELLVCQGFAHLYAGDNERGRQVLERAVPVCRAAGDAALLAIAALGFTEFRLGDPHPQVVALLEEVLDALGEGRSPLHLHTRSVLAVHMANLQGRLPEAHALATRLEADARAAGRPRDLAAALAARAAVARLSRDSLPEERLVVLDEAILLAQRAGDPSLEIIGRLQRDGALIELGDRDASEAETARIESVVARLRSPYWRWIAFSRQARACCLDGRFDEAEGYVRQAFDSRQSPRATDTGAAGFLAAIRYEQGRLAELMPLIEVFASRSANLPILAAARLLGLLEAGRADEARAGFEALAANAFEGVVGTESWIFALAVLSDLCVAFGDAPRAEDIACLLEPRADHCVIAVNGFYCHGPVALQLGRLALLADRLDAADAHLDHALARAEALRSPVWRAHALHARSRLYRRLGTRADRSRADRCAAEAREIARSAGLVRLLRDLEGPGTA